MNSLLKKLGKIVGHVKKSTNAIEELEKQSGLALISKNETCWNSQLEMVRRILELDTNATVDHQCNLTLTSHDKLLLQEFVQIFEKFEDATDLIQADKYVPISLAVSTIISLHKHLSDVKSSCHYSRIIVNALLESLKVRYIAATLDPLFNLKWCQTPEIREQTIWLVCEELHKVHTSRNTAQTAQSNEGAESSNSDDGKKKQARESGFLISWKLSLKVRQKVKMK